MCSEKKFVIASGDLQFTLKAKLVEEHKGVFAVWVTRWKRNGKL